MILVTGGTGLVGSHLLFQLVSKGLAVRAVYRDFTKLEGVRKLFGFYSEDADAYFEQINWSEASLNDIPALEEAFSSVTHVYHCAALISFDPGDFKALVRTNQIGTANVVNLCITNKVHKLCYVSSIATLGKTPDNSKIDEETAWNSTNGNPYALTKHLAEMEVWRGTQEGVPAVIVNPGVIIGPGNWKSGSGKLFRLAAKGLSFYPPGGSGFVSVDDVIRMMVELMESEIENEQFIAVESNLSYQEVLSDIALALGRKVPTKKIPMGLLKLLWRLDWLRGNLSGQQRKLTKAQVASLMKRSYYNTDKARHRLKFEYTPLLSSIEFTTKKFRESNPSL
ncbi:MAG: NAD-dependent epimerase/dehydratase family protein [Flavobacteriaceae bacterium]